MEPTQGFLLNGGQCQTGQLAVVQRKNHTIPAGPGTAEAGLTFGQVAMMETQFKVYPKSRTI